MRFASLLIAPVLVAGLVTTAQAQQSQQIRVLGANPQGSVFYAASATLGKLLDDKLKMQVRVQPMGGSSTYIPLMDRAEIDFGLTNVDDAGKAFKGGGGFRQPNPNLRLMAAVFELTNGILVPADSPIQKIADLKGVRMPSGYKAQITGVVLQDAVLATGGLTMKDIRGVPAPSLFAGVDLLAEGKVDAANLALGTAQVQNAHVALASRGGIRYLDLDDSPAALAAIRKHIPARIVTVQPGGNRVGISKPTRVIGYAVFFSTNAKMPDDVVYNIVKVLHGSKADMAKGTPVFGSFEPGRMTQEIGVPYHPGAIKFFREIGQWPPKP